jgi:hypothetical protein
MDHLKTLDAFQRIIIEEDESRIKKNHTAEESIILINNYCASFLSKFYRSQNIPIDDVLESIDFQKFVLDSGIKNFDELKSSLNQLSKVRALHSSNEEIVAQILEQMLHINKPKSPPEKKEGFIKKTINYFRRLI